LVRENKVKKLREMKRLNVVYQVRFLIVKLDIIHISAKKWDNTCDIYLGGLTDYTSDGFEAKSFLDLTAQKKYMKLGESKTCQDECQLENPNDPDSPVVCGPVGGIPYYQYDDGMESDTCPGMSPTFIKPCRAGEVPSGEATPADLSPGDTLFQRCRTFGACQSTIRKILIDDKNAKMLISQYNQPVGFMAPSATSNWVSSYKPAGRRENFSLSGPNAIKVNQVLPTARPVRIGIDSLVLPKKSGNIETSIRRR
jgi:hypothetical protein